jgi:hypothetical protein
MMEEFKTNNFDFNKIIKNGNKFESPFQKLDYYLFIDKEIANVINAFNDSTIMAFVSESSKNENKRWNGKYNEFLKFLIRCTMDERIEIKNFLNELMEDYLEWEKNKRVNKFFDSHAKVRGHIIVGIRMKKRHLEKLAQKIKIEIDHLKKHIELKKDKVFLNKHNENKDFKAIAKNADKYETNNIIKKDQVIKSYDRGDLKKKCAQLALEYNFKRGVTLSKEDIDKVCKALESEGFEVKRNSVTTTLRDKLHYCKPRDRNY